MLIGVALVVGWALLLWGGEWLVRGGVLLGRILGWSTFVMGVFVISFGTSAPEFFATLHAHMHDASALALGNVVGSNIANVGLILGCGLLMSTSAFSLRHHALVQQSAVLGVATLLLVPMVIWLGIGWVTGAMMLATMAWYLWSLMSERPSHASHLSHTSHTSSGGHVLDDTRPCQPDTSDGAPSLVRASLLSMVGIVSLALGAELLVYGAVEIALVFGLSQAFIGLTLLALGTSLPELFATIAALKHKAGDAPHDAHAMIIGNVMGSCFFNLLGILGIASMLSSFPPEPRMSFDSVMLTMIMALWLWRVMRGGMMHRPFGVTLLCCYGLWLAMRSFLSTDLSSSFFPFMP
ncbi:MAG: hypothetical protein GDA54_04410 [Alphaproteobacteria bacterium GM7ARS4]|nr:hypothetical protein [Alphaproteobacteria bacterium GM7ARS4]